MSAEPKEWWAYVLVSEANGETYVGVTVDMQRRLGQHNGQTSGGARRTTRGRPWGVGKKFGPFLDQSEAQEAESAIKRLRGQDRLGWEP